MHSREVKDMHRKYCFLPTLPPCCPHRATLAFAEFVVLWVVFFADSSVVENMILYTLLTLMTAWAHSKTTLTNPGTVARGVIPSEGEEGAESSRQTLYGRCELYKPTR